MEPLPGDLKTRLTIAGFVTGATIAVVTYVALRVIVYVGNLSGTLLAENVSYILGVVAGSVTVLVCMSLGGHLARHWASHKGRT